MKLVKGSFAFASCLLLAGAAQAATVTYTLYQDKQPGSAALSPGNFYITAKVSGGDNAGLSGYGLDLTGDILTLNHVSPFDNSAETATIPEGPTGFGLARAASVAEKGLGGAFNTSNPDVIPIYGLGQQAGGFVALGITVGGQFAPASRVWDAELLLATGTNGATAPGIASTGPYGGANVWVNNSGLAVRAPETIERVVVPGVPEPTSVVLGGLGLLGFAAFRRRSA